MIKMNSPGELRGMSPPLKRHLELEIKTRKCSKRCRQAKKAFASKTKAKRGRS